VGVHNTEYEVMAEDPGSTMHTLVKTHSSSFGGSSSPGGSFGGSSGGSGTSSRKMYLRPSEASVGVADTRRPFADGDVNRGSAASTMTGSSHSSLEESTAGSAPGAGAAAAAPRGFPSPNTTASAYMAAVAKSGLTGDHSPPSTSPTPAAGMDTGRHSTSMARLSRLSLGVDNVSFDSNSVAHSQDTENSGDLGYARKLEVRQCTVQR
jgi:hypothetical protein